ncbi:SDR family oxidoreductase [Sagittula sp. SSi028]|uniref:SDR family oxidoreductase n=1 Tax=Sagittula sp. SSi028 TaxID=3400636 RepID=UPI003AF620C6
MTKTILVAGATGSTGAQVVQSLEAGGHKTISLVRESSDTSVLPETTELRYGDLAELPDDVCDGADVVIFAAGSGSKTGPEMTDKIDRDGAQRLVDLAKSAGVERFVMLSSVGADQSNPSGDLAHYLQAKHDADAHLQSSGLTHAILRPVALTDDGRSDGVILGDAVDTSGKASRADVAALLAEAAVAGTLDGQAVNMQSA